MKLQQLRYVVEIERCGLNVSGPPRPCLPRSRGFPNRSSSSRRSWESPFSSAAASAVRHHRTRRVILEIAGRILREAGKPQARREEYGRGDTGRLILAATHTQARYAPARGGPRLRRPASGGKASRNAPGQPDPDRRMGRRRPGGSGHRHRALDQYEQLVTLPVRQWSHCVIAPEGHPIAARQP